MADTLTTIGVPGNRPAPPRRGDKRYGWYIAPAILIFGTFLFLPLVAMVVLSFFDWNLIRDSAQFVGLENYAKVVLDPTFVQLLRQTLLYVVLGIIGNCLIPTFLAALTLGVGKRALGFYRTALFLPTVVASAVGAIVWQYLLLPTGGPVNTALQSLGLAGPNWFTDPNTVIFAIAVIASWNTFGFTYVIALGGLSAIPASIVEAARLDGAHGWRMLTQVTIPMASPTLIFVALASVLQALPHAFVPIHVITGGGPNNASNNLFYDIYRNAFQYFQVGSSGAGAVILVFLLATVVIAQYRITDKRATYGAY